MGEPLIDAEGIVYADIDLSRCIQPRQNHDIIHAQVRAVAKKLDRIRPRADGPVTKPKEERSHWPHGDQIADRHEKQPSAAVELCVSFKTVLHLEER